LTQSGSEIDPSRVTDDVSEKRKKKEEEREARRQRNRNKIAADQ
jgi:hypothetical protein